VGKNLRGVKMDIMNQLLLDVKEFEKRIALEENNAINFDTIDDKIKFFERIVDEYLQIKNNILYFKETNIENEKVKFIDEILNQLENSFKKISTNIYVKNYFNLIKNKENKMVFFKRLRMFEKDIGASEIVEIDSSEIQDIVELGKKYAKGFLNNQSIFYYQINPFKKDEIYNIPIPVKKIFNGNENYSAERMFVDDLYQYVTNLYYRYKKENEIKLTNLLDNKKKISELLIDFDNFVTDIENNKVTDFSKFLPEEFYKFVEQIENKTNEYSQEFVKIEIFKFHSLNKRYQNILDRINKIIDFYKKQTIFKQMLDEKKFINELNELNNKLRLLEKGIKNAENVIINEKLNLKELVNDIIKLSKMYKFQIKYEKYDYLLKKYVERVFEFYQTYDFEMEIKKYYYEILYKNLHFELDAFSIKDIDDENVKKIKNKFMNAMTEYKKYINFMYDTDFISDMEFQEYFEKYLEIKDELKKISQIFFDKLNNVLPQSYENFIQMEYKKIIDMLFDDEQKIKDVQKKIIKINDATIKNIYVKIKDLEKILEKYNEMYNYSKKNSLFLFPEYFDEKIINEMRKLVEDIKNEFKNENYEVVKQIYDNYMEKNDTNFKFYYVLSKYYFMAKEKYKIFSDIEIEFQKMKFNKQTANIKMFLSKIFDDKMIEYKVMRNEYYSLIDEIYIYLINKNKNLSVELLNEENIKKIIFDNELVKVFYIKEYVELKDVLQNYSDDEIKKRMNDIENRIKSQIVYIDRLKNMLDNKMLLSETNEINLIDIIDNGYEVFSKFLIEKQSNKNKIDILNKFSLLEQQIEKKYNLYKQDWELLIEENDIPDYIENEYEDDLKFKGHVPLILKMNAKPDDVKLVGDDSDISFEWEIENEIIKGKKIEYTFYNEGNKIIKCYMKQNDKIIGIKEIKVDVEAPVNSNIVKNSNVKFNPIDNVDEIPKLTYFSNKKQKLLTIPLKVEGNIEKLIENKVLYFQDDNKDYKSKIYDTILFGFEGDLIAGKPFDYKKIFDENFDIEKGIKSSEFMFDIKISDPIVNKTILSLTDAKYTEFMTKIPDEIKSPYEIVDATKYNQEMNDFGVIPGDIVLLKNKSGRYALLKFNKISTKNDIKNKKLEFLIDFDYYINISLNKYDKMNFAPKSNVINVPTIVFKNDIRETFINLIEQLERMKKLNEKIKLTNDEELKNVYKNQIDAIENEMKEFYIFDELDKLKIMIKNYERFLELNGCEKEKNQDCYNKLLKLFDKSISFEEYMTTKQIIDFKKDLIHTRIIKEKLTEQLKYIEFYTELFKFKIYDKNYYQQYMKEKKLFNLKKINEFDAVDDYLTYIKMLINEIRKNIYKIKLVTNLKVYIDKNMLKFDKDYMQYELDVVKNEFELVKDFDLYLLMKKLEMKYGPHPKKEYGIDKQVENLYNVLYEKDKKISSIKKTYKYNMSNYIQKVEEMAIESYDDFFLIPFFSKFVSKYQ
jgi:hypothetical protein